ncbi:MAG TPA: S1/P1 nuclease [Terriglobia bacterium]|nr:S1/P1 nuclease [Terriglobia bacterium]
MRRFVVTQFLLVTVLALPSLGLGWGHEGHAVIALIAEHNMTPTALDRAKTILGGQSLEDVASWADDYRRDHRETGPWHYIDIPLADTSVDLAKECPNGDCVIVKTEEFLGVLKDPSADAVKKADALRFVIHFVGDLHQPLHDADNGDKGGNERHVIFDGKPDNLHWVWDTGLLEHINHDPQALAAELERQITPQERTAWERGTITDWVLEGHHVAVTVAYGDLGSDNPAVIGASYEAQADLVIETQLEKAGVRLAELLDQGLR